MAAINPHYITDAEGNRISVVLTIKEYNKLMEELEMAEDVKIYDEIKSKNEPTIVAEEAFSMIE